MEADPSWSDDERPASPDRERKEQPVLHRSTAQLETRLLFLEQQLVMQAKEQERRDRQEKLDRDLALRLQAEHEAPGDRFESKYGDPAASIKPAAKPAADTTVRNAFVMCGVVVLVHGIACCLLAETLLCPRV